MKQWMLVSALVGAAFFSVKGHGAGPELGIYLQAYHQCLAERSGPECTDRFYEPIFRICQDPAAECMPELSKQRPGGMSFRRCKLGRSCHFVKAHEPHLELRIHRGEERAELRDPYELPYGASMDIGLEMRLPPGESLSTQNGSIVVAQLHAKNGESPSFALRLKKNGDLAVTVRHRTDPADGPGQGKEVIPYRGKVESGQWVRFHVRVRTGANGLLVIRKNGARILNYKGPLGYYGLPHGCPVRLEI